MRRLRNFVILKKHMELGVSSICSGWHTADGTLSRNTGGGGVLCLFDNVFNFLIALQEVEGTHT